MIKSEKYALRLLSRMLGQRDIEPRLDKEQMRAALKYSQRADGSYSLREAIRMGWELKARIAKNILQS